MDTLRFKGEGWRGPSRPPFIFVVNNEVAPFGLSKVHTDNCYSM